MIGLDVGMSGSFGAAGSAACECSVKARSEAEAGMVDSVGCLDTAGAVEASVPVCEVKGYDCMLSDVTSGCESGRWCVRLVDEGIRSVVAA